MAIYAVTLKNTWLAALITAAGTGAKLELWAGTVPATAETAITTQTKLVSLALANPIGPAPSGGAVTLSAITPANAVASGTATFFRIMDTAGTTCLDQGTVGITGSDWNFPTMTGGVIINIGVSVAPNPPVITVP
jgi:hypothetical protein